MTVGNEIIRSIVYAVAGIPWNFLFLAAWKRSLFPTRFSDALFGAEISPPGLRGKLKYIVIIGGLTFYMNAILWFAMIPAKVLRWDSFPQICIEPRTFMGLGAVPAACWSHFSFLHFGNNNLCTWSVGPMLLSYNRRTFVFATFFVAFIGDFLVWLCAPSGTCHAGFSVVLFGWFAVLTMALFLECPPKPWRVAMLLVLGAFLGGAFYEEVIRGDDTPGVSWYAHAFGFGAGIIFGYVRFRRGWFLFEGLEDRVRPLGSNVTVFQAHKAVFIEMLKAAREGAIDLWAIVRCRGPVKRLEDRSPAPSPQKLGTPAEGAGDAATKASPWGFEAGEQMESAPASDLQAPAGGWNTAPGPFGV